MNSVELIVDNKAWSKKNGPWTLNHLGNGMDRRSNSTSAAHRVLHVSKNGCYGSGTPTHGSHQSNLDDVRFRWCGPWWVVPSLSAQRRRAHNLKPCRLVISCQSTLWRGRTRIMEPFVRTGQGTGVKLRFVPKNTTWRATCVIATIARRIGQRSFIPLLMKFKELPPTLLQTLVLSVLIGNNISTKMCTPLCGDQHFCLHILPTKKKEARKDREHRTQQSHVQIIVEWIPSSSFSPLETCRSGQRSRTFLEIPFLSFYGNCAQNTIQKSPSSNKKRLKQGDARPAAHPNMEL